MGIYEYFAFGCLFGFTGGLWLAKTLFCAQLKAKARTGFRLECGGNLYTIRRDKG
jgi:hypothetical protein